MYFLRNIKPNSCGATGCCSIWGLCHTDKQMLCLPQTNMLTPKVADAACLHDRWKSDQIQTVPHPGAAFIIPTGHQLSAAQHSRKPGKSSHPEEYFSSVLKMAEMLWGS